MSGIDTSSTATTPAISVILPVYNAERFLEQAVRSVLDQTFRDFELLALDDGSNDNSLKILQKLALEDTRIQVYSRENKGLSETLNELVTLSAGNYIARMDADDVCLPQRLEKQFGLLEADPSLDIVGTSALWIDDRDRPICRIYPPASHKEIDDSNLNGSCAIIHPTIMARKNILKNNKYNPEFDGAEDLELWLRIGTNTNIFNCREILFKYRIHPNSISEKRQHHQRSLTKKICISAAGSRGLSLTFREEKQWRPDNTPSSLAEFYSDYAWRAWNNNYRQTWRYYAIKAVMHAPFSLGAWKTLIAGMFRRPLA